MKRFDGGIISGRSLAGHGGAVVAVGTAVTSAMASTAVGGRS
ncbi:hypothetical protein [Paenibacillus sp. RC67]|nr:hypothetical protein [Paenibacillus sp. RC67]